jgi:hypothetical protein
VSQALIVLVLLLVASLVLPRSVYDHRFQHIRLLIDMVQSANIIAVKVLSDAG